MKIFLYPLLFLAFIRHDFHVSITEIHWNEGELQVTVRSFTDDLDWALEEQFGTNPRLGTEQEHPKAMLWMERYLNQSLLLEGDGKVLKGEYLGMESEYGICFCFLRFSLEAKPSQLSVENRLLFELFDDQRNVIHYRIGLDEQAETLHRGEEKTLFTTTK